MAPLHEHFRDKVGENHRRVGSGSPAEGARLATQGTSREEGGPPRTTERQRIGTAAGVSEDKPPPDSLQALLSTRSFLRPQRRRRRRYSRAPKERKQPLSFHVRIFITLPLSLFIYLLIASTSTTTTLSLSLSLSHTQRHHHHHHHQIRSDVDLDLVLPLRPLRRSEHVGREQAPGEDGDVGGRAQELHVGRPTNHPLEGRVRPQVLKVKRVPVGVAAPAPRGAQASALAPASQKTIIEKRYLSVRIQTWPG